MDAKPKCPDQPTEEFIADVKNILLGWMIRDAKAASSVKAHVGALILGICALDVLGGFLAGVKLTKPQTFEDFIEAYLPNKEIYIDSGVYKKMRCNLVHGYSTEGFKYTDEFPAKHLQVDERDGKLWIHVDTFLWEVETAARMYLKELPTKDELWLSFKARWHYAPLLGPIAD